MKHYFIIINFKYVGTSSSPTGLSTCVYLSLISDMYDWPNK